MQPRGGDRADTVADLFDHHRISQFGGEPPQGIQRAGKIGVPVGLHGLLQRIGMHRNGIGSDPRQCASQSGRERIADLSQADVPDQQNVGGQIADLEAGRGGIAGRVVAEHDALRPQHHADAEFLRRVRQVAVDGARQFGTTGHRADQDRRRKL